MSGNGPVEVDQSLIQPVGISASWRKLMTQAEMAGPHLQVATIEGESGVGKHTLARFLYRHSSLGASRFERRDAREWLATDADAATLSGFTYLDRVDLLASTGQGLLLGILRSIQDRTPGRAVVLAGTETSLRQMAGQGLFLPDLAYRLSAIRFAVPALRLRREDVAPLAQSLLDRLCQRYKQRPVMLGPGTLARLLQHNWPGNVRELASVLEAALLEAENGVIRPADLPIPDASHPDFGAHAASQPGSHFGPSAGAGIGNGIGSHNGASVGQGIGTGMGFHLEPNSPPQPENLALDSVIRHHVQYVLDLNRGNKLRAARQLAISRSTLYRILSNESLLAS
jgi:DNA-binding NtrC family response regulator